MSKEPKIMLVDGGVIFDFICSCGHKFRMKVWGMIYKYDKKGVIVSHRNYTNNFKKCKCGVGYLFVTIPDVGYKKFSKKEMKKQKEESGFRGSKKICSIWEDTWI